MYRLTEPAIIYQIILIAKYLYPIYNINYFLFKKISILLNLILKMRNYVSSISSVDNIKFENMIYFISDK